MNAFLRVGSVVNSLLNIISYYTHSGLAASVRPQNATSYTQLWVATSPPSSTAKKAFLERKVGRVELLERVHTGTGTSTHPLAHGPVRTRRRTPGRTARPAVE